MGGLEGFYTNSMNIQVAVYIYVNSEQGSYKLILLSYQ